MKASWPHFVAPSITEWLKLLLCTKSGEGRSKHQCNDGGKLLNRQVTIFLIRFLPLTREKSAKHFVLFRIFDYRIWRHIFLIEKKASSLRIMPMHRWIINWIILNWTKRGYALIDCNLLIFFSHIKPLDLFFDYASCKKDGDR